MGREAKDIVIATPITRRRAQELADDQGQVLGTLSTHTNVIFETARFNRRIQEPNEFTEALLMNLHRLTDTFNYETWPDDLIRDRKLM